MDHFRRTQSVCIAVGIAVATCGVVTSACSSDTATGTADAGTQTSALYERLGGEAGVKAKTLAISADLFEDPDIASFFVFNDGSIPGRPNYEQLDACFVAQVNNLVGGPEKYPTTKLGFACRDMKAAHAGYGISNKTFDKFIAIAGGTLMREGVSSEDIATILKALNATKGDMAGGQNDSFPAPASDAGGG